MSPWKVILATMVIFGCGVITGALVERTGFRPPPPPRLMGFGMPPRPVGFPSQFQNTNILPRMAAQLNLTTNQYVQIENIMHETLWTNIELEMQKDLNLFHAEIRQVLTPEQQKKYDILQTHPPRRTDGLSARDGDPFHPRTNRFRTNGFPTNLAPSSLVSTNGT